MSDVSETESTSWAKSSHASGCGMLLQNRGKQAGTCNFCPAPSELMLVWSTPDRMYGLKGRQIRRGS